MHNFIRDNWDKTKYLAVAALTLMVVLILLTTNYKNDELVKSKKRIAPYHESELLLVKNFFFSKIRSPFLTVEHQIKRGENIQKILKNYKINNNEIEKIIKQYKKYTKPNQLIAGNII